MSQISGQLTETAVVAPPSSASAVIVAATFTAEPLADSLRFWLDRLAVNLPIEFASYNQVVQTLLDPHSAFSRNRNGLNVVLVRFEDWNRYRRESRSNDEKFNEDLAQFASALKIATTNASSPCLVCICPSSTQILENVELANRFQQGVEYLRETAAEFSSLKLISSSELLDLFPSGTYYDGASDELGHIPYNPAMFAALSSLIARSVHSLRRAPHKVVVLDCDETLWAGICGERGSSGVEVEVDEPHQELQQFMREQKDKGMLLCVCSKNNPEDVDAVFETHTGMCLRREDVAAWRVNWLPKSENIRSLARELNVGLDSLIFIDDNPLETAEVRANCPGVLSLTLPKNPQQFAHFLNHVWAFDRFGITSEDRNRASMYQTSRARRDLETHSLTYADFLKDLAIEIDVRQLGEDEIARAAQLTQRTNQFNLTTIRNSDNDIARMFGSDRHHILTVNVRDRFGDYGQVGLAFCEFHPDELRVTNLLISCRVLGRGVEHAMVAHLGRLAKSRSLSNVEIACVPSKKNVPARDFLAGFPSEYRSESSPGFRYRLPSDFAAGISFHPANRQEPVNDELTEPAAEVRRPVAEDNVNLDFEWIARYSSAPNLVLEETRRILELRQELNEQATTCHERKWNGKSL